MVTRDVLFEKMIATAILLSMDGIITSFSGLKLRLTNTLDQLCHSLLAAGAPEDDVDRLCKILCAGIDASARTALARQQLSWEGYALTHHYYGYEETSDGVGEPLASLLQNTHFHFHLYAEQLLFLLSPLFPQDSALQALWAQGCASSARPVITRVLQNQAPRCNGNQHRRKMLYVTGIGLIATLAGLWFWCVNTLSRLY
ncbi:DotU family type IV/VI secretion system protein [Cronobacter dublinensis]|uniref:DotU family type IV/VI secretion system protein n=1 Tax=Cronobacter dublinensis TaxID=413497 RepID=UPI000CFD0FFF|nr:DotU family type IV/VI secretion system protein [Cronobacter dublinensis]